MRHRRLWLYSLILLALNLFLAARLFKLEYGQYMGSIEGTFIGLANVLMHHPGELRWFPTWMAGIPFDNTYLPLLHLIAAAFGRLSGFTAAHAYHAVIAVAYAFGPVTLFWMAAAITQRLGYSFVCALGYSLISPSNFLISEVRNDSGGFWNIRRFYTQLPWGDSPHVVSLTWLPLAVLFLYLALQRRKRIYYVLAGVFTAATVLTNAFGIVSLAMGIVALLLSAGWRGIAGKIARAAAIGAATYLWISPFLPPSLIATIHRNSTNEADFPHPGRLLAQSIVAGGFVVLWLITERWKPPFQIRFFLLFAWLGCSVPLLGYWFGLIALPQARRYHLEIDLVLWLFIVFALQPRVDSLQRRWKAVLIVLLLVLGVRQVVHARQWIRHVVKPIDITKTIEYQTAQALQTNFPGERVFATGSCGVWLNAFTEQPQFQGGHYTMEPNYIHEIALYIISSGEGAGSRDGQISTLWLEAFGVNAITVSGPNGRDAYHPTLANPRKFDGLLPVAWRDGDDTIYRVPQRSTSLAHVIPESAVVTRAPVNGLDTAAFEPYVQALDDPSLPLAPMRWTSFHTARIATSLKPGEVVSVQMTYHAGWHATVNGAPQRVTSDAMGLTIVKPECDGPCTIDLLYDGGVEAEACRIASGAVSAAALLWLIAGFLKRPRRAGTPL